MYSLFECPFIYIASILIIANILAITKISKALYNNCRDRKAKCIMKWFISLMVFISNIPVLYMIISQTRYIC